MISFFGIARLSLFYRYDLFLLIALTVWHDSGQVSIFTLFSRYPTILLDQV